MAAPLARVSRARKSTLAIGLLAVLAVVGIVLATMSARAAIPAAGPHSEVDAQSGPPLMRTENGPSALFIGDSYTMGPGSMPDYGYPCVAATNMGWQCNLGVQPATGYISGGAGHRLPRVLGSLDEMSTSLAERFPRLRQIDRADVVFLDGGRNDFRFGPIYMKNMFIDTVRKAKEAWPNSRIVVICPWFINQPVVPVPGLDDGTTYGQYLNASLREFPELDDVVFIDPGSLGWFEGMDVAPFMSPDGIHPNIAGNKRIGDMLTNELINRGFTGPAL